MALLNMLRMSPFQMGNITFLSTPEHRLVPRVAMGGPWAGYGFLPLAVLLDPEQIDNRDALLMLEITTIETDDAFPPDPDA